MTRLTGFHCALLTLLFWQTDANVNISETGTKTGISSFECGKKLVLTCQIDGYSSIMSWQNDSSSTPLAECSGSTCAVDPTVAGLYNISADTSDGIFNLTFFQLTLENHNSTYICAHGLTSDSFLVIVKDYEPTVNESNPGMIEVSSGCIDNNTEVTFKWEKVKKANLNIEDNYQDFQPSNITNSSNKCLGNNNCEPSHFVKKSCLIKTEPDGGEDDYHIRALLYYDGFVVKSALTTGIYKIYDGGSHCRIKCDTVCRLLIWILVCFVIVVIVGCLLLYVMLILYPTKKDDSKEDKWLYIEILLNTFSAILWIVIVILFFWSLHHCCSCDDPSCHSCKIMLKLRYVLGTLFCIHVILWLVLLFVLYKRKDKEDGEDKIYLKTKLVKVRIVFSSIPMAGIFPVCGWLILIYRYENRTTHDKQLTSEKETRALPSIPELVRTNNRIEDKRKKSQKRVKKEHDKIDQLFKQTIVSSEDRKEQVKEYQLSASEITIVKPKGTDTKNNANIQKSPDARSEFTHSVTKQLSQKDRNILTRSQDHNKENEKNMLDNQNHGPHSDENPQRKIDVTNQQSGSKNKSDSKDEVKPKKRKSRKETDENKSTKNTEFVITDAHTGNAQVTKTGSNGLPDSGDDVSPSNMSKSDKTVPNKKKSRKNQNEKQGPNNNKPLSEESHNGSETMKRALSANFDDKYDSTTTVSIDSDTKM